MCASEKERERERGRGWERKRDDGREREREREGNRGTCQGASLLHAWKLKQTDADVRMDSDLGGLRETH